MRSYSLLGATFFIGLSFTVEGCGSSSGVMYEGNSGTAGKTGKIPLPVPEGGTDASQTQPPLGPAEALATGQTSVSGVTSDGWVVFRATDVLKAVKLPPESTTQDIIAGSGNVLIRGHAVFNWKDVDWTTNMGDLSVWTSETGTHHIGITAYSEGQVAASALGRVIAYTANANDETMDLMITPADLSAPKVLIAGMGRGSDTTCGPSIGFVGERLFVGWCAAGSRSGKIERYEDTTGEWKATLMADDALPAWSSSSAGERVFYQSSSYSGRYSESGETHPVDTGVSGGFMLPDGTAALYTVGDQLRRTAIPDVRPLTIVTRGYSQVAEFTKSFDRALYSSTVNYDNGTRRDLRIIRTDGYNPEPTELVPDPVAGLPRSALTKDGQFVLYFTDGTPSGATLHVCAVDGHERLVLPNVAEAVAAHDGTIVFTDNSSDPNKYPIVADLKMLNLPSGEAPVLLEGKIAEPRNFQLDPTGKQVVYVRSGVDRDGGPDREGLFVKTIP